jgi:outer membrane protein
VEAGWFFPGIAGINAMNYVKSGAALLLAIMPAAFAAQAGEWGEGPAPLKDLPAPPGTWIVEIGGYAMAEPHFEGSSHYGPGLKPIIDIHQAGDRQWLTLPNDAWDYALFEGRNYRAGPAGDISLQSRHHSQNVDFRLGRADFETQIGGFAEYWLRPNFRTRAEVLRGVTGSEGLVAKVSGDYVWQPGEHWLMTFGPRAQFSDDVYASDYFSTRSQNLGYTGKPFHAGGGFHMAGAEWTGTYDWSPAVATKFFIDYSRLAGDAADSPRVDSRGAADQFAVGVGASYKFSVKP